MLLSRSLMLLQGRSLMPRFMSILFWVPGLLESVYETCLCYELSRREMAFQRQTVLPICYDGNVLDSSLRIDVLVAPGIIAELKAIDEVLPIHKAQLLTYMKLAGCRLGLLLNFNVERMKEGIVRRIF